MLLQETIILAVTTLELETVEMETQVRADA